MHIVLHAVHIAVRRSLRIAGKEVACEIHGLDVVLRAKVHYCEEVNALARVLHVLVQQFEKRIGVQPRLEQRTSRALDGREGLRRGG